MYRITANFYKDFFIYKDDDLIMIAKRRYNWFFGVTVKVYLLEDKLVITYKSISFFFTRIKIKYQDLPDEVMIVGNIWGNLCLKVSNHIICCKFNSIPQRKMGKIEIDDKEVAKITNKKIFGSSLEFEIEFPMDNKLDLYCVLLFLMKISAVESF